MLLVVPARHYFSRHKTGFFCWSKHRQERKKRAIYLTDKLTAVHTTNRASVDQSIFSIGKLVQLVLLVGTWMRVHTYIGLGTWPRAAPGHTLGALSLMRVMCWHCRQAPSSGRLGLCTVLRRSISSNSIVTGLERRLDEPKIRRSRGRPLPTRTACLDCSFGGRTREYSVPGQGQKKVTNRDPFQTPAQMYGARSSDAPRRSIFPSHSKKK